MDWVKRSPLPLQLADEQVDLTIIEDNMDSSDYSRIKSEVLRIKSGLDDGSIKWTCMVCEEQEAYGEIWLCCDACLSWFHLQCVGKKVLPKKNIFICRFCVEM